MVEMNNSPKRRNLRVVQWLSSTPVFAVCTFCGREFKVPMSALSRTVDAQANLQQQFDRHTCQLEDVS
jgi:transcription elongation factor Elf1